MAQPQECLLLLEKTGVHSGLGMQLSGRTVTSGAGPGFNYQHTQKKELLKKSFEVRIYGLGQLIIVLPNSDGQFADLYRGDKNNVHSQAWWHIPLVPAEKERSQ